MSGEPKPSQDGHQPLQTLGKFLPSKQPVVGSNPTGGVATKAKQAKGVVPNITPTDGSPYPLREQWLVLRSGATHQRSGSDGFPGQPISLHSFFSSLIGLEIRARSFCAACSEQATFSGESSAVVLSH